MGKAGVLQNGRSLHIPDREKEVIWATVLTQILLILSHISAAQRGGTLPPSWHNGIPDGAQFSLSMPQRHPALNEVQFLHLGGKATCGFTSPLFLPLHKKHIQFEKHYGGVVV